MWDKRREIFPVILIENNGKRGIRHNQLYTINWPGFYCGNRLTTLRAAAVFCANLICMVAAWTEPTEKEESAAKHILYCPNDGRG